MMRVGDSSSGDTRALKNFLNGNQQANQWIISNQEGNKKDFGCFFARPYQSYNPVLLSLEVAACVIVIPPTGLTLKLSLPCLKGAIRSGS